MMLKEYAERGLSLSEFLVIDIHCHLGAYPDFHIPYDDDEEEQFRYFCRSMDRVGVDYAGISMLKAILGDPDANLTLADYMDRDERVLGWVAYLPHKPKESLEIIDHCFARHPRYIGVKIHPDWNQHPLDGAGYDPLWEYADSRGLPVMSHTWFGGNSDPARLSSIVPRHRNMFFLLAHAGGVEPGITSAIDLVNGSENVYLDLTGAFIYSNVWLENYAARADTKRLLFSSDTVFNSLYWELGNILFARIPDPVKLDILGLNARRLLDHIMLRRA